MTLRIENCSMSDIHLGHHSVFGDNTMLIRIQDPAMEFKPTKVKFAEVYCFEFLDIEDDGMTNLGDGQWTNMSEFAITDDQAKQLVSVLQSAQEKKMNVVVHCHAGICRSGAVVEVASMMGFVPTAKYRQPNLLVKHKMLKALGWSYN